MLLGVVQLILTLSDSMPRIDLSHTKGGVTAHGLAYLVCTIGQEEYTWLKLNQSQWFLPVKWSRGWCVNQGVPNRVPSWYFYTGCWEQKPPLVLLVAKLDCWPSPSCHAHTLYVVKENGTSVRSDVLRVPESRIRDSPRSPDSCVLKPGYSVLLLILCTFGLYAILRRIWTTNESPAYHTTGCSCLAQSQRITPSRSLWVPTDSTTVGFVLDLGPRAPGRGGERQLPWHPAPAAPPSAPRSAGGVSAFLQPASHQPSPPIPTASLPASASGAASPVTSARPDVRPTRRAVARETGNAVSPPAEWKTRRAAPAGRGRSVEPRRRAGLGSRSPPQPRPTRSAQAPRAPQSRGAPHSPLPRCTLAIPSEVGAEEAVGRDVQGVSSAAGSPRATELPPPAARTSPGE
nr:uncharacterized protein LOC111752281 [Loxodonta africana]